MSDFERALPIILKAEGGFVADKDDRGGATNYGITERVYHAWLGMNMQNPRPVKEITPKEVEQIYAKHYWFAGHCDQLPWPVSLAHFDACVNHGVGRAAKMLQDAAGVKADGAIGPKTLAAVKANPAEVAKKYLELRESFYKMLAMQSSQSKFLKGWLNRLGHLRTAMEPGPHTP